MIDRLLLIWVFFIAFAAQSQLISATQKNIPEVLF
jgi:hypothetical protein